MFLASNPIKTITFAKKINTDANQIQCVVSKGFTENEITFGATQKPQLWDYADDVDSIAFLLEI